MICNGCGFYYSNDRSECPECGCDKDLTIDNHKQQNATRVSVDHTGLNDQQWICYMKRKYRKLDDDVFAPIREKWDQKKSIKVMRRIKTKEAYNE